jgi:hypothetical protein
MSILRFLGFGPKKAELLRTTILQTSYRLKGAPVSPTVFRDRAAPGLLTLAASTGAASPQVLVQIISEHEGATFVLAPSGAEVDAVTKAAASAMEPCALAGSLSTSTHNGFVWTWAAAPAGCTPVTLTRTTFDIRDGAFEDFVSQFGKESHQLRPHAEEFGILWQATFAPSPDKVTLLSTFKSGADGPKRMGPRLQGLYDSMGMGQFLTARPLIDTSEHGSYLKPVDFEALSVSA